MQLTGKGYFLWRIQQCENGNADRIADAASDAGLSHMIIKIADGGFPYNVDKEKNVDFVPDVIRALRARNISVWGWHYVYGNYPRQEADIAVKRINQLKVDGYVINAEGEYKIPGRSTNARIFMSKVRDNFPNLPIALSSFRYPNTHREFPWHAFVEHCDLVMPQVYWMKSHGDAGQQLMRCVKEYKALFPQVTIFPTGPVFKEWGWMPYKEEVDDFLKVAKDMGLPGVNFYSFDQGRLPLLKDLWKSVKEFQWGDQSHPKGLAEQLIDALNTREIGSILSLYEDQSYHIRPGSVIKGKEAINKWMEKFINDIAPLGKFIINSLKSFDNSISFAWQLQHANTTVLLYGKDVLMLHNNKISQHYSYFSEDPIVEID